MPGLAIAAVNKDGEDAHSITIPLDKPARVTLLTLNGDSKDAYNDVAHEGVTVRETDLGLCQGAVTVALEAHSVNVIQIG